MANRYEQLIGQLNLAAHLPTDLSCSSATRCQIEVYLYIKLCCKSEDDSEECSYLEDFYDEDDEPQDEHPSTSSTEKKGRELDLKLGRIIHD